MSIDFKNRVAVITGAGGGLGRQYALEIARRGGAVVVNDFGGNVAGDGPGSPDMADGVVAEIREAGGSAIASYDSVAETAGARRVIEAAMDEFGRVDALVTNAGNLQNDYFENIADDVRDRIWNTHLRGNWDVTRAAWPHMQKAGYGRILFVASGVGMFGNPTQAAYGAAKAGIIGIMNTLAQEGRKHGIMCNALLPNAESRMGEAMFPDEMAPLMQHSANMAGSISPPFVMPVAVYLCSEACTTTHDLYSVLGGRIARGFLGVTEGWVGPRDEPPSVEDVADHIDQIRDLSRGVHVPESLIDEFRIVAEQIEKEL